MRSDRLPRHHPWAMGGLGAASTDTVAYVRGTRCAGIEARAVTADEPCLHLFILPVDEWGAGEAEIRRPSRMDSPSARRKEVGKLVSVEVASQDCRAGGPVVGCYSEGLGRNTEVNVLVRASAWPVLRTHGLSEWPF